MSISRRRAWLLMLAVFLLASCSPPPIQITTRTVDGHVVAELSQDWGIFFANRKVPCLSEATLYGGQTEADGVVWRIRAEDALRCSHISSIVIGRVPPGFEQIVPLPSNAKGPGRLVVNGIGWGEATLRL